MRIEPAIRIHARIQQQADIVAMRQNAIRKLPRQLRDLLLALRIPEQVLAALGDRHIRVHAAAVHAHNRLRQEARRHAHLRRHLAADQLVQLNLVRSGNHFAVACS